MKGLAAHTVLGDLRLGVQLEDEQNDQKDTSRIRLRLRIPTANTTSLSARICVLKEEERESARLHIYS